MTFVYLALGLACFGAMFGLTAAVAGTEAQESQGAPP